MIHFNDPHHLSLRALFDEWVDHVVKEVNVKEALKLSIFVVQMAAAAKNGVEFRQVSNGTIRSNLATLYNVCRRRQFFLTNKMKQTKQTKETKLNRHTEPHIGAASLHKNPESAYPLF